jgi:TPR repeat protein
LVQAAQQQHAHAALLLGQELARGERLRRDPNAARRWLQQARQAGLPEAQTALDRLR